MLAYWDSDLNKSVDMFLNPICILRVDCTSTIAVCIAIYANNIVFKLTFDWLNDTTDLRHNEFTTSANSNETAFTFYTLESSCDA